LRFVPKLAGEPLPYQPVDRRKKGGEGFPGSGRGGDQNVPGRLNGRPSLCLRRGGRGKAPLEPPGDGRMKQ
jgi:hypothetical protein